MRPTFFTILVLLLFTTENLRAQNDSVELYAAPLSYTIPIQLIVSAAVYTGVLTGLFNRSDVLSGELAQGDIGAGFALLSSCAAAGAAVFVSGELLLGPNPSFLGYTMLGALVGFVPWKLIPETGGNWRIINFALPPAFCATAAYTLQALFSSKSSLRIAPFVGYLNGIRMEYSF
jgi:hypothetical protein